VHSCAGAGRPVVTDIFRPPRALGVIVGGGFALWAAFIALVAAGVASGAAVEFKTFVGWMLVAVFAAIAAQFAWWTFGLARLAYEINDEALRIRWGVGDVVIPIADIQRVVPGGKLDETQVRGLNWWGCHVGLGRVRRIGRIGRTLFFATHGAPEDSVYVVTSTRAYALTVADQAAFAAACTQRLIVGIEPLEEQHVEARGLAALPFWRDNAARFALALTIVGLGVVAGFIYAQYPDLSPIVKIEFPETSGIVRVGEKSELLHIGAVAGTVALINMVLGFAVHSRERAASVWLFASAALLQAVMLGAAVTAFERA